MELCKRVLRLLLYSAVSNVLTSASIKTREKKKGTASAVKLNRYGNDPSLLIMSQSSKMIAHPVKKHKENKKRTEKKGRMKKKKVVVVDSKEKKENVIAYIQENEKPRIQITTLETGRRYEDELSRPWLA